MDTQWDKMYQMAKAVQNGRKISDYIEAGGVAEQYCQQAAKSTRAFASIPVPRWESARNEMPFFK